MRDRGKTVLDRLKVPPDHKFPTVKVTNPMLFAIACTKFAMGRSQKARGRTPSMDGTGGIPGKESSSGGVWQRGGKAGIGNELSPEGKHGTGGEKALEALELKEKECGIDFVSKGDTYFEGFVEEDEKELIRRGGVGFPPCYDSVISDSYDTADFNCSDGDDGESDDGDGDLGLSGRGTSPAVHGSVLRPESNAGVAASSASSGFCEEADNRQARLGMASESSALTSAGGRGAWWGWRAAERADERRKCLLQYEGRGSDAKT